MLIMPENPSQGASAGMGWGELAFAGCIPGARQGFSCVMSVHPFNSPNSTRRELLSLPFCGQKQKNKHRKTEGQGVHHWPKTIDSVSGRAGAWTTLSTARPRHTSSVYMQSFQILLKSVCRSFKKSLDWNTFPGIMLIIMCWQFASVIRRSGNKCFCRWYQSLLVENTYPRSKNKNMTPSGTGAQWKSII